MVLQMHFFMYCAFFPHHLKKIFYMYKKKKKNKLLI